MYKSFEELPGMLDQKDLKDFFGISRAGVYNLLHSADFPTLHINSRLLVTKENLRVWMEKNTNKQYRVSPSAVPHLCITSAQKKPRRFAQISERKYVQIDGTKNIDLMNLKMYNGIQKVR